MTPLVPSAASLKLLKSSNKLLSAGRNAALLMTSLGALESMLVGLNLLAGCTREMRLDVSTIIASTAGLGVSLARTWRHARRAIVITTELPTARMRTMDASASATRGGRETPVMKMNPAPRKIATITELRLETYLLAVLATVMKTGKS